MNSKKQKILIVGQENLGRGGIQSVIMSIVRSLHDEYSFDIILLENNKRDFDDEFLSYGGKIFHCPTYQGRNKTLRRADFYIRGNRLCNFTRKVIRRNGPYQAIHCNASIESAVFLRAAFVEKVPVRLVQAHGIHSMVGENFVRRMIDRLYISWINRFSTKCLGVCEEAYISHYGRSSEPYLISVPYDETKFNPALFDIKPPSDTLVITQVGQFCPNKNQIFTIKVFAEIIKRYPDALLNCVGFDNIGYLPQMQSEIRALGLDDSVRIYPSDYNIPALLSESDAFMFPSYSEGFGIAVVEAQAMGVRCYASNAVPRSIDCGGCTYLPLDAGAEVWADAIISDFKKTGGKHGKYDCSRFERASVMKEIEKLYTGEK